MTSTCVTSIASKLFSKNLISDDVQDQVITGQESDGKRASKVLYAVTKQIKIDPRKLLTLVEVLQQERVFDDITKEITGELWLI